MKAFSVTPRALRPVALKRNVAMRASFDGVADRRALLVAVAGAVSLADALPASSKEGFETFFGLDTPPTSYGGYGGNIKEAAKYSFEHPEDWKATVVNKVQKGTQGIDCILSPQGSRGKGQRAFVITLARAGEDKVFRLTDSDSTFQSFVGADYDMQDAVASGDLQFAERMVGNQLFYDYLIQGDELAYRASVTIANGKVYALFIKTPIRAFPAFKDSADYMIQSFRTL